MAFEPFERPQGRSRYQMSKCVFLDRDGVINKDNPNYTFTVDTFEILPGVVDSLALLKQEGYLLVIVTNQSGISRGLYTVEQMKACHEFLQKSCGGIIDGIYYSPYHRTITASLLTKPGTLMFEKAIAKFGIDVRQSWMIGDRGRDLVPAKALGIRTIQAGDEVDVPDERGEFMVQNLTEATAVVLGRG